MISNMTSDLETIQKESGYCIGNLYVSKDGGYSDIKQIPFSTEEGAIYDRKKYNFHLYPVDAKLMKEISDEFAEKKNDIVRILKEKFGLSTISKGNGRLKPGNIGIEKISPKYEGANRLFQYISYKDENGTEYELNFMRYYFDESDKSNKTINCILRCLQFDMVKKIGKIPNFPKKKDDVIWTTEVEQIRNIYYNPQISFCADTEAIAEEFWTFIQKVKMHHSE